MTSHPSRQSSHGLDTVGLHNVGAVYWNLTPPSLYEAAVERGEAEIAIRVDASEERIHAMAWRGDPSSLCVEVAPLDPAAGSHAPLMPPRGASTGLRTPAHAAA